MNRRGFLGFLASVVAAPVAVARGLWRGKEPAEEMVEIFETYIPADRRIVFSTVTSRQQAILKRHLEEFTAQADAMSGNYEMLAGINHEPS